MGDPRPRLTARTDDSHAAPLSGRTSWARTCRRRPALRRVRCPVYCRIKPHTPPFQQAPANLIRSPALRLFPRRGALRKRGSAEPNQHPSLTVWTTRVSNTDRCPYFRSSASSTGGELPWPLVARGPSPNFTSQARGPLTSRCCKHPWGGSRVYPALKPTAPGRLSYALRPVTTSNAPSAMSYRNCWHIFGPRLSGGHAWSGPPAGNCLVRENACSGLGPLTKIPHCCLWRDPLRSQVAGRPQSPARDRWLSLTPNPTRRHRGPTAAWWCTTTRRSTARPGQPPCLTHPYATPPRGRPGGVRLACVRRLARIRSEL